MVRTSRQPPGRNELPFSRAVRFGGFGWVLRRLPALLGAPHDANLRGGSVDGARLAMVTRALPFSRSLVWAVVAPALSIASLAPLLGAATWLFTARAFLTPDPDSGAPVESTAHALICFVSAQLVVSAAVGFVSVGSAPSIRRAAVSGALGGALICLVWLSNEGLRGVAPSTDSLTSNLWVVVVASAACAAGAWLALHRNGVRSFPVRPTK